MPKAPEHEAHPRQAPVEPNKHDFFVSLAITRGPKFYEGKKHSTNREIAEVLTEYAAHSDGVLREVFSVLAKFHLQAVEEVPAAFQDATGSFPDTAVWGPCGSCRLTNGNPGRTFNITVNGVTGETDCYPCSPSGLPSG